MLKNEYNVAIMFLELARCGNGVMRIAGYEAGHLAFRCFQPALVHDMHTAPKVPSLL